jgi:hypothetical protein
VHISALGETRVPKLPQAVWAVEKKSGCTDRTSLLANQNLTAGGGLGNLFGIGPSVDI